MYILYDNTQCITTDSDYGKEKSCSKKRPENIFIYSSSASKEYNNHAYDFLLNYPSNRGLGVSFVIIKGFQNNQPEPKDGLGAGCVKLWICSAEPPWEHRYEN